MKLTYATRRSALALAQCRAFVARLEAAHPDLEMIEEQVVTTGDKIQDRPLSEVGGKGLFVKEIEEALLERRADLAVHSIKDVPGVLPPGLFIACIPTREDPRDVLVSPKHGGLDELPRGAKVGTSSLRRAVSLRASRPDLEIVPLRGNVDTRLRKVDEGECDAIVLARAGLVRLGLEASRDRGPRAGDLAAGGRAGRARHRVPHGRRGDHRAPRRAPRRSDEPMRRRRARRDGGARRRLQDAARRVRRAARARRRGVLELHLRAFICDPDGQNLRRGEETVAWPASDDDARIVGEALGADLRTAAR